MTCPTCKSPRCENHARCAQEAVEQARINEEVRSVVGFCVAHVTVLRGRELTRGEVGDIIEKCRQFTLKVKADPELKCLPPEILGERLLEAVS